MTIKKPSLFFRAGRSSVPERISRVRDFVGLEVCRPWLSFSSLSFARMCAAYGVRNGTIYVFAHGFALEFEIASTSRGTAWSYVSVLRRLRGAHSV